MKERFREIGWMGWTALALSLVLFVGAIVAINTTTPEVEEERREGETAIDASENEVANLSGDENREIPEPVIEDTVVGGDASGENAEVTGELPATGAMGEVEFEYYFDWE